MNQHSNSARFMTAMAVALIVVGATWMVRHPSDATRITGLRAPASKLRADSIKSQRLQRANQAHEQGKVTGSFSVSIAGDDGMGQEIKPDQPGRLRLRGVITADRPLPAQEYSWIIPPEYRVVGGVMKGSVPELQAGQQHSVAILLESSLAPSRPIVLHVFKLINAEPRGQIAQFDVGAIAQLPKSADTAKTQNIAPTDYVQ